MSQHTYLKAKTILDRGQFEVTGVSSVFVYMKIKEHQVKYNKRTNRWYCDCEHEIYRIEGKEDCSHIKAAKIKLGIE